MTIGKRKTRLYRWIGCIAAGTTIAYRLLLHAETAVAAEAPRDEPKTWKVTVTGNGDPWSIAYGSNGSFPQVAALDPRSGYFRLVDKTTWGTSIVLTPSFWSGGTLIQGMPVQATTKVENDRLVINATGSRNGLKVILKVSLSPPKDEGITADVEATTEGSVSLDNRPGESFKPVMLSSMRVKGATSTMSDEWDARQIVLDEKPPALFDDTIQRSTLFVPLTPRVSAKRFGFVGGKSKWQMGDPAPTVIVQFDSPMTVAGFLTKSSNPNDDNLGFWAATDSVAKSWHYTVTASRPSN
jgi:hypothetical protein